MTIQRNAHVGKLAVMQRKPNRDYALAILKDIAHQVSLLMRENHFKVGQLVEFYPKNKRLLGMNVNGGSKIMLRLRQPFDEDQFLSREQILGTMLHELAHNVCGPHNAAFYRKLDELMARQWVIEQRGLFDGFVGRGRKLGARPRARIPGFVLGDSSSNNNRGVNVLGGGDDGSGNSGLSGTLESKLRNSAKEMAALAAQQRAKDAQWCGRSKIDEEPDIKELEFIDLDSDDEPGSSASSKEPEVIDLT
ncbi:LAME_0H06414g1_1 [Lachancea meyersii CBS 8951]|uniref:LAME_0H06414g1_1 n=1 Tax=Lachancea meyersii CBS 8951 TaxID=1266667 RepID=A0A1G4KEI0_9SACH|nr:LAME_0H06414g1_1 [Lachancea meyersii CBS 8951]